MNCDIANMVELQHYVELDDIVHMAIKVERQLKKKGITRMGHNLGSFSKPIWSKNEDKPHFKLKIETSKDSKNRATSNQGKIDSQPS